MGIPSMITASEYRRLAEECFCLASQAQPQAVKQAYIDLGKLWLETAARLDERSSETLAELKLTY
jgi:hypothetical protein